MNYDHEVTLIDYTYTQDAIKQQIPTEVKTTVLCRKQSESANNFADAGVEGMKVELTLVVHEFEYAGQTVIEFNGKKRKVLSTYTGGGSASRPLASDEIELKCSGVVGLGN